MPELQASSQGPGLGIRRRGSPASEMAGRSASPYKWRDLRQPRPTCGGTLGGPALPLVTTPKKQAATAGEQDYNSVIDDGSGSAQVFIDGYNGSFAGVKVFDSAQVIGLTCEDGEGQRIRVRKQEDVTSTPAHRLYLPLIFKNATR